MEAYFNILNSTDPLFHSYVLSKLEEIQEQEAMEDISMNDLSAEDELDILRRYCVSVYREHRMARSLLLENMEVCTRSVRIKTNMK